MRAILLGTGSPLHNPKRRGPARLLSLVTHAAATARWARPVVVGEDLTEV